MAMHSDKQKILNAVCEQIKQKLPKKDAELCQIFTQAFFGTMAADDILQWPIEDLYAAALNFWDLFEKKQPQESKIKIYNPDFENYAWQSTHTVLEILTTDMPFLVESVRMAINRLDLSLHLAIHMGGIRVVRDSKGHLVDIISKQNDKKAPYVIEAPMFFLIDKQTDTRILEKLKHEIEQVLLDNFLIVRDWMVMRERILDASEEYDKLKNIFTTEDIEESQAFLKWIENHHFTIFGMRDYELCQIQGELIIQPIQGTGYGILSDGREEVHEINLSKLPEDAQKLALSPQLLILAKSEIKASVHRDAFMDYIGVKRFNQKGEVIGERRIYGLFTSATYYSHIKDIPLLRRKVKHILEKSQLDPRSHAGRILLNILETMPRDDLIQGNENELFDMSQGIFHLQDRKRIRLFARTDIYNRFISSLIYVPKELYNTELRRYMENVLAQFLNASSISFSTLFSESVLARIHFMIHLQPGADRPSESLLQEIESKMIEIGRTWTDDLQDYLIELHGEELGKHLFNTYKYAFSPAYTSYFSPRVAIVDIKHLEKVRQTQQLHINFYRELDNAHHIFHLKLYQAENTIPLSDVLPIIENLGLRAISERPFALQLSDRTQYWVNEFTMSYPNEEHFEFERIRQNFEDAFLKVWLEEAENDGFNRLVLSSGLTFREISMLRAYAKYFKQIGMNYSHDYMGDALLHHPSIVKELVKLFSYRFSPDVIGDREVLQMESITILEQYLEFVENLDEDKIIRQFIVVIRQTLRTNYYQINPQKSYISFKFNSAAIPGMPKPYPKFEIFVYSPRFEGVHLRCSSVSRGGLRWSDRREDFRTEVLGLMKAQQVKNAVIVPNGAKGGFYPKHLERCTNRDEVFAEGVACYQSFIRGLLDITDNYIDDKLEKPPRVISYDEPDPYLVVAADKGTATFSDYANAISKEYHFWLGDAFASGGSNGYDHKKIAITARGAWESVKNHFYYLGKDIQTEPFTVVGIGDMAGDVFGNGMLLSKHIKLVAAFNHQHIFLDPEPHVEKTFEERERLFHLPRSSWRDYNEALISKGGGIFDRSAKFIKISPEIAKCFNIEEDRLEPNQLIRKILTAEVDLLWSAGIGTFVKSSKENNTDVGDRTNDLIRVNANMLNCKVVGEGGNLGFTQRARIEFALKDGKIYTDFIDNSGGVSCSDKEVNIKILLDKLVKSGDLTLKQRDSLLSDMTDEVVGLVLRENIAQTKALSLWGFQSLRLNNLHERYIAHLEKTGKLDRKLEFIPSADILLERKNSEKGLVIPEIAILFCYSKILLKEDILKSNILSEPYFEETLIHYFPKKLSKKYAKAMTSHPLKREIIATSISNLLVNEMGATFVYRLHDETGAPTAVIVSAYLIARKLLKIDDVLANFASMKQSIDANVMADIQMLYVRLLRRLTRWLLRSERRRLNIQETIDKYEHHVEIFRKNILNYLGEKHQIIFSEQITKYIDYGLSKEFAYNVTSLFGLFAIFDIIEVALERQVSIDTAASAFFSVGAFLQLDYIRKQMIIYDAQTHWEALSREALRDDMDAQQRQLTASVLHDKDDFETFSKRLAEWSHLHQALIERWSHLVEEFQSGGQLNFIMFFVAIRELLDLTQTAMQTCSGNDCY